MEPALTTRIVGIVLVRNEQHFVTWAIGNALAFCDELLVIDNRSLDHTPDRLKALAAAFPGKIRLFSEPNALRTNAYLQTYVGTDTWIFGLDGDEIYDRDGLARLRERVLAGEFARYWTVFGHSLHARQVDLAARSAVGYLTPAAAPATKLYNFAAVASWHADTQRLHGMPVLNAGWAADQRLDLARNDHWEDCDFRNLHLCFFPRSPIDIEVETRANITDRSFRNVVRRPLFRALQALGLARGRLGAYLAPRAALKKPLRYAVGEIERRILSGMGRPSDFASIDPAAADTERLIGELSTRRANEAPPST